jgi:aminoglycoside-2''-adenylyltransferase
MRDLSEPQQVARLLHDLPCPWGIAGGWAIDLFLDRVTREHQDVEVAIFRQDQSRLQDYLCDRGWSFEHVRDGRFNPWLKGEFLVLPIHEIWGRSREPLQRLEVLLNERDTDVFIFRRDPRIMIPLERVFLRSKSGIPILAPEIVLLYKSKRATEHKEQLDFSSILSALHVERRKWLIESLSLMDPEHEWLPALSRPNPERNIVLQLEHSVDTAVSLEFAWNYRTDIANWNDPPAEFVLDGPFIAGTRGTAMRRIATEMAAAFSALRQKSTRL